MKSKSVKIGKNFGNSILNNLIEIEGVISVTIVGSFSENFNIQKIGDLDVVVICKELNKSLLTAAKKKVKEINIKDRKLKINTSFGPIKFDPKKYLTIHLMIYDVKSHVEHVIKSPFTCFDWQRSKWNRGKKLGEIFPVYSLQLRDFFESRRGSVEYLKDLKNNRISYRDYYFKKNRVRLKKKIF